MMTQVNIDNPSQYKPCRKKNYSIWACKPPYGTVVINKLEQAGVLQQLAARYPVFQKRAFLLASEYKQMLQQAPDAAAFLAKNAYIVNEKTPFVLSGTQGEMWCIAADKLAKTYTFATGEAINMQTMREKCGVFDERNSFCALNSGVKVTAENWGLKWQKITTIPVSNSGAPSTFACFVPNSMVLQLQTSWGALLTVNDPYAQHGLGDFVLCSATPNGTPNLSDRWVVNGLIFGDTYNNQGWSDKLMNSGTATEPEKPHELFNDYKSAGVKTERRTTPFVDENTKFVCDGNISADVQKMIANHAAGLCEVGFRHCTKEQRITATNVNSTESRVDITDILSNCRVTRFMTKVVEANIKPTNDGYCVGHVIVDVRFEIAHRNGNTRRVRTHWNTAVRTKSNGSLDAFKVDAIQFIYEGAGKAVYNANTQDNGRCFKYKQTEGKPTAEAKAKYRHEVSLYGVDFVKMLFAPLLNE